MVEVLLAAARDPRVEDAFATTHMRAELALTHCSSPESAAEFIVSSQGQRSQLQTRRVA
jgi:hypothetical protein